MMAQIQDRCRDVRILFINIARRCGPLSPATSSSCGRLMPSGKAFYAVLAHVRTFLVQIPTETETDQPLEL